jgi:hypothetical protein
MFAVHDERPSPTDANGATLKYPEEGSEVILGAGAIHDVPRALSMGTGVRSGSPAIDMD